MAVAIIAPITCGVTCKAKHHPTAGCAVRTIWEVQLFVLNGAHGAPYIVFYNTIRRDEILFLLRRVIHYVLHSITIVISTHPEKNKFHRDMELAKLQALFLNTY